LADDHAVVREGLRFLLEKKPDIAVIGEAGDGRTAVQMAQKLHPDVVVMDITMPELNGIEAARQIHEISPSTGVVILSMHATSEHIFQALKAGAKGYLLKESAGSEVVKAVRTVHAGGRYLCSKIDENAALDYICHREMDKEKSPLDRLSEREREILQLVVESKSSSEIAKLLSLSPKTVETYRSRLMAKLCVRDVQGLVKFAIQHGLSPSA
jgi:DNA-binding NarL/FixJ family response regulator